jgi:hypothetical protein
MVDITATPGAGRLDTFVLYVRLVRVTIQTTLYVDSNAVGSGSGLTWADALPNLSAALAKVRTGDIIYVASDHSVTHPSGTFTYNFPTALMQDPSGPFGLLTQRDLAFDPLHIISADKTSGEPPTVFQRGAFEGHASPPSGSFAYIYFGFGQQASNTLGPVCIYGMDFISDRYFSIAEDKRYAFWFYDCSFYYYYYTYTGDSVWFEKCTFRSPFTTTFIIPTVDVTPNQGGGPTLTMIDCEVLADATSTGYAVIGGNQADANILVDGLDSSTIGPTSTPMGMAYGEDHAQQVSVTNMLMPNGWEEDTQIRLPINTPPWMDAMNFSYSQRAHNRIELYNVGSKSSSANVQMMPSMCGGVFSDETTVHTGTWNGTNKYSIKLVAIPNHKARAQTGYPMTYAHIEFLSAANPTVTIKLTSDFVLTDQNCWASIRSNDATKGSLARFVRSRNPNYFLGSGTGLTAGSGWTNPKTYQYEITLSVTGSQAGAHRATVYLSPAPVDTDRGLNDGVDSVNTYIVYIDPNVILS